MRKTKFNKDYPREYDFFQPSNVYIVHELPTFFRFRIGARTYEASRWRGHSARYAAEHRLSSEPVLRIGFDKALPIDEALSAVWEWRRFFSQVAMAPLTPKAIGARGRTKRSQPNASLYLSNLAPHETSRRGRFDFGPGDSPYFRWRDRAKLGDLMKAWLSNEPARRVFRVTLDRVIEAAQTGHSLDHIVSLCSAIESLDELVASSAYSKTEVGKIADGAIEAARAAKVSVKDERIRSVLGMLRSQSLPDRMRLLAKPLGALLPADVINGTIASAHALRQVAAHGRALEEPTFPTVGPTIDALAGMCALYDLITCGAPPRGDGHQLTALSTALHQGGYLRNFKPTATSP